MEITKPKLAATLTDEELAQYLDEVENMQHTLALRDPWYQIVNFHYTLDEHDATTPIKKFPNLPYLEQITDVWLREKLLIIAKSRQLMLTWLMSCLHLTMALNVGKKIFYQSKKEEDANAILDRTWFTYQRLPRRIKWGNCPSHIIDMSKDPPVRHIYCKLEFPWLDSQIQAVPQGADILRSHTASAIFSDEFAFQDKAEDAFTGSKPTIDGGGKFTAVSTPNGQEYFYRLLFDIDN